MSSTIQNLFIIGIRVFGSSETTPCQITLSGEYLQLFLYWANNIPVRCKTSTDREHNTHIYIYMTDYLNKILYGEDFVR